MNDPRLGPYNLRRSKSFYSTLYVDSDSEENPLIIDETTRMEFTNEDISQDAKKLANEKMQQNEEEIHRIEEVIQKNEKKILEHEMEIQKNEMEIRKTEMEIRKVKVAQGMELNEVDTVQLDENDANEEDIVELYEDIEIDEGIEVDRVELDQEIEIDEGIEVDIQDNEVYMQDKEIEGCQAIKMQTEETIQQCIKIVEKENQPNAEENDKENKIPHTRENNIQRYFKPIDVRQVTPPAEVRQVTPPAEIRQVTPPAEVFQPTSSSEVFQPTSSSGVCSPTSPPEVRQPTSPPEICPPTPPPEVRRSPLLPTPSPEVRQSPLSPTSPPEVRRSPLLPTPSPEVRQSPLLPTPLHDGNYQRYLPTCEENYQQPSPYNEEIFFQSREQRVLYDKDICYPPPLPEEIFSSDEHHTPPRKSTAEPWNDVESVHSSSEYFMKPRKTTFAAMAFTFDTNCPFERIARKFYVITQTQVISGPYSKLSWRDLEYELIDLGVKTLFVSGFRETRYIQRKFEVVHVCRVPLKSQLTEQFCRKCDRSCAYKKAQRIFKYVSCYY